MDSTLALG
ncbi:hypothetical protein LINGRAHAP2_LOCUS31565 [Linum grandiflorum]